MIATAAPPEMNLARLQTGRTVMDSPGLARRLRERARLSQGDLAAVIGSTPSTISKYETGDRRPSGQIGRLYLQMIAELAVEGLPVDDEPEPIG